MERGLIRGILNSDVIGFAFASRPHVGQSLGHARHRQSNRVGAFIQQTTDIGNRDMALDHLALDAAVWKWRETICCGMPLSSLYGTRSVPKLRSVLTAKPSFAGISIQAEQPPQM